MRSPAAVGGRSGVHTKPGMAEPATTTGGAEKPAGVSLEEDDEFEEFEQQEWTAAEQDADDTTMWQDGWEDDEEDDQFTKQLRAELAKTDGAAPAPMQS